MPNDRMICEACIHERACHIKHRGSEVCAFFDDRALWARFSPVTKAKLYLMARKAEKALNANTDKTDEKSRL